MKREAFMILGAVLTLSGGRWASAETYDITYTGVVGDLTDTSGYFGAVDPGRTPFAATFIANLSQGVEIGFAGGYNGGIEVIGGTSYTNLPTRYGTALSPVSAILTINGKTLFFAGQYNGVDQENDSVDIASPPPQPEDINVGQTAVDAATATSLNSDQINGDAYADGPNAFDYIPFGLTTPYQVAIDGTAVHGSLSFSYATFNALGAPFINASGDFDPEDLQVSVASAAPEPSTWALLFAGVGLAGTALRFRRRRTPPLAT